MKTPPNLPVWTLIALLAAAVTPAMAQTNVEDRLKSLEQSMKALEQENKELKTQLGWDGKSPLVVVKPGGKESKITLGGFVHGQGEFGGTPDARFAGINDRFYLRRARVNVAGTFAEHFDFKLEADFGANSLSGKSGFGAQLTDVYLNWNRYEAMNVKFGQFKTPFGYDQLISDTKLLTIERSFANDRQNEGRQIGVGVAGDFLKKRVGYSVGAFNGTGVNTSINDNDNFLFAGRLYGVPVLTKVGKHDLRWAVALDGVTASDTGLSRPGYGFDSTPATPAADNIFTGNRNAIGVDTQVKWGPLALEAEYLRGHARQTPPGIPPSLDADGWYVTGAYMFLPKWQAVVRYDCFDPNLAKDHDTAREWTFGLTYYLKGDDLKFMVNYVLGNGGPDRSEEGRLLTRIQYMF